MGFFPSMESIVLQFIPIAAALVALQYHISFIVAVSIARSSLLPGDGDVGDASLSFQKVFVRNELDTLIETFLFVPAMLYSQALNFATFVSRRRFLFITGLLAVPFTLMMAEFAPFWIPLVDDVYEYMYDFIFFPAKSLLTIYKLKLLIEIPIRNLIARSIRGSVDIANYVYKRTLLDVMLKYAPDFARGLTDVLVELVEGAVSIMSAIFSESSGDAKIDAVLAAGADEEALHEGLVMLLKSTNAIPEFVGGTCQSVAFLNLEALSLVPVLSVSNYVDLEGKTYGDTPFPAFVTAAMTATLDLAKTAYLIVFQFLPLIVQGGTIATNVPYCNSSSPSSCMDVSTPNSDGECDCTLVSTTIDTRSLTNSVSDAVRLAGQSGDYALHVTSVYLRCLADMVVTGDSEEKISEQFQCVLNGRAKGTAGVDTLFIYPKDYGILYALACWYDIALNIMRMIMDITVNLNHLLTSFLDTKTALERVFSDDFQNSAMYNLALNRFRFEKHMMFNPTPFLIDLNGIWTGGMTTLGSMVPMFQKFADMQNAAGGLTLAVAAYAYDFLLSVIMGPILPECPRSGGYYQSSDVYDNNYCYCNDASVPFSLEIEDSNLGRFPYVRPLPYGDTSPVLYSCETFVIQNQAYAPVDYNRVLQNMPPCPYTRTDFPPFEVEFRGGTWQSCTCHSRKDYSTTAGWCICGMPGCACTIPFNATVTNAGDPVKTYCMFDPKDLVQPPLLDMENNAISNFCLGMDGVQNARAGVDPSCLCPDGFGSPVALPHDTSMLFCPETSSLRFEEFIHFNYGPNLLGKSVRYGYRSDNGGEISDFYNILTFDPEYGFQRMYSARLAAAVAGGNAMSRDGDKCRVNGYLQTVRAYTWSHFAPFWNPSITQEPLIQNIGVPLYNNSGVRIPLALGGKRFYEMVSPGGPAQF